MTMEKSGLTGQLSKRLKQVMELVSPVDTVADVGCDHGYVAISLVQQQKAGRVIAMDINKGPLAGAAEHIRQYGADNLIELRLSDGVEALNPGEADAMILAGMGGKLVAGILERGYETVSQMKELILQPQSDLSYVRVWLREHGFAIDAEAMVFEDGKYYPMMRVIPVRNTQDGLCADAKKAAGEKIKERVEDRYGPKLLGQADPVLLQFLQKEKDTYEEILHTLSMSKERTQASLDREKQIAELLEDVRWAQAHYYSVRETSGRA